MVAVSGPLFDPAWYRVAGLRPRLRSHVMIHRHHYRGELWYVLQDPGSGRFHRFSPGAYQLIGLMDGARTMTEIWDTGCERFGDDAPTQREAMHLLYQLHAADVLQTDVPPDVAELLRRHDKARRGKILQNIKSPLAIRIPLYDPERLLVALVPYVRPLFGWAGALLWLALMLTGATLALLHWPELSENVTERVLTPQNLVLIWIVFPVVKLFHEFGHAFAVKVWGGEVHQTGVMLLVLTPVPYVDASFATAFREKHRRFIVGAAGMLTELALAALAMIVWAAAEPGVVRTLAYNVMIIAGVSTVLFNGNPLLRFDAYYMLADAIEIPNLAGRANRYFFYLLQRYGFGAKKIESPVSAPGERPWFLFYAIASFFYRMFIYTVIVVFVAGKFFLIGVILALWATINMLVLPLFKGIKHLFVSPALRRNRARTFAVSGGFAAAVIGLIGFVPLPLATMAEGVLWVPDDALIRSGTAGVVADLVAEPGQTVTAEQALMQLEDPLLPVRARVLEHELAALEARYMAFRQTDLVQAEITGEEIAQVRAKLERVRGQLADLVVRSGASGELVVPYADDLPGSYVQQGEHLGFVVDRSQITVQTAIGEKDVDRVRRATRAVAVRLVDDTARTWPARVRRFVPQAIEQLPSAALGTAGGGQIPVDPQDTSGRVPFVRVFQVELALPADVPVETLGSRVYVRFDHGLEPLARRWYRDLRRLFLSTFDV
jgi:putative peptide zinc metalloprotease protein